ncbi:MAG: ptrA 1 [Mucilaginibacter sp.]|uniref:M16 family metallopeptidase n=1 Tax=Mucilaginibacter sp. TaxID=1882438 RepID=UPI002602308D|nr:M16 family metallopeptidase [Mucilaginibacter sp.]MDB5004405.1 ptrA 1 [Mucilaginibacter sp.]
MNVTRKKSILIVAGCCLLTNFVTAQNLPLDPAVKTGRLTNGFTYYVRHNTEPKNRVYLYLVNKVGSILEDEDQRGLAHFMEHMSFNGTKHFPKNELVDYLQKSGVRFGADLNAYTSFDETVYQLPLPTDKPELLKNGFEIMRDWAQEATLGPIEINKERGVVLEEKRLGKGAQERMRLAYWPVILNHSRYAERLPIGLDTVLNHFKPEALRQFYHDWYRPDLQALIVVGDIDVAATEKLIKTQFGNLKNPAAEKKRVKYNVPLTGKNNFIAVTDKEMTSTVAEVMIKHPLPSLKTATDYRDAIVQSLFNQMLGRRLAELTRQSDPPFIGGNAGIGGFIGGLASFDASVTAKPGELEKGFKAIWREVERVKQFGFTATELDRAKSAYLNRMETALKEKDKTNSESYVKEYQEHFLKEIAAPGIGKEFELVKEALPQITLKEVNGLAGQYITAIDRDIIFLAPEKDTGTLPNEATVNSWLKSIEQELLKPYDDQMSNLPLLAHQPIPGKVVKQEYDPKLGLTTLTLSNGLKVILKPTDFKNNEIIFSAFAPGGNSLYPDSEFQSAANASALISANGAGNYNPTQLSKYLEGKQLSVQPYISERFNGINGGSTVKDFETALQLIYAKFTEPRKDTAIFKGIMERSKGTLANRGNNPNSVFQDTITAVLGNHHFRRMPPSLEKLGQISLDKSNAIYQESFADAANFTFTFVGSFSADTIKPLLEKYLGSLPSINKHEEAKDLHIHVPEGEIEKTVYKGTEPKATVLLVYAGKFDYSQVEKIALDALKETLEIRLLERLREEESGVYSPAVYVSTNKYPEARYSLTIQFGCAPQNVKKLIASAQDEVRKLCTKGPSPENVDKWRNEEKTATETQLKTNGFWLGYLTLQLQNKEEASEINSYYQLLDKLKPADVQVIAAKYLGGKNYIQLELLPETAKK